MQVRTQQGSTYAIAPSRRGNYVQVARVSDHAVATAGDGGRRSFAEDFPHVEVVSDGVHLRLLCIRDTGHHLRTSPIVDVIGDASGEIDIDLRGFVPSHN